MSIPRDVHPSTQPPESVLRYLSQQHTYEERTHADFPTEPNSDGGRHKVTLPHAVDSTPLGVNETPDELTGLCSSPHEHSQACHVTAVGDAWRVLDNLPPTLTNDTQTPGDSSPAGNSEALPADTLHEYTTLMHLVHQRKNDDLSTVNEPFPTQQPHPHDDGVWEVRSPHEIHDTPHAYAVVDPHATVRTINGSISYLPVSTFLPPVRHDNGIYTELSPNDTSTDNEQLTLSETSPSSHMLPLSELKQMRRTSFAWVRQDGTFHEWIPGVSTPEGIVLISGVAVLVGSGGDVAGTLERFASTASTAIVTVVSMGGPIATLTFLS